MKKLFLPLFLWLLIPTLVCKADMMASDAAQKVPSMPPTITLEPIKVTKKLSDFKFQTNPQIPAQLIIHRHYTENNNFYIQENSSKEEIFLTSDKKYTRSKYAGFLSQVSPEYKINRNFLSLSKVNAPRRKQAFMFVFLMNPNTHPHTLKEQVVERTRVHILWPGSRKRMGAEQKLIDHEYPVDVSVANYEDGYAADEWNVVLPNKKPREIDISLLWSF
jgi:hypothetical protein